MRLLPAGLVLAALGLAGTAAVAETFDDVPVIDTMCLSMFKDKVDTHTRECALQCMQGGYGVILTDGTYLRLDGNGNKLASEALKASTKKDHLRVTVVGERKDDILKVESLKLK